MASDRNFVAAIDIGSSKIIILFADKKGNKLSVFGRGIVDSDGVENGVIVDIAKTTEAIKKAVKVIYEQCDSKADGVICNFSDLELKTQEQYREFPIKSAVINEKELDSAIKHASATLKIDNYTNIDKNITHFTIDQKTDKIKNPIGLSATLLGVNVHITYAQNQVLNSINRSLEGNNLLTISSVFSSNAGAEISLSTKEKDSGVCFIDIGSGVSNISLYLQGVLCYSQSYLIAGDDVDNEIAYAFDITIQQARKLKEKYGRAQLNNIKDDKLIKILENNKEYYLSLYDLIKVIEKQYLKIYEIIWQDLKAKKFDKSIKSGFVLSGGGAKLPECNNLLLNYSKLRTKIAKISADKIDAKQVIIDNPIYSCALGLLVYDFNNSNNITNIRPNKNDSFFVRAKTIFQKEF